MPPPSSKDSKDSSSSKATATAAATAKDKEKEKEKKRQLNKRCGECDACKREDCGTCVECVRKKKFGGTGGSKQACIERRCVVLDQLKRIRKRIRASGGTVDDDNSEEVSVTASARPTKRRRSMPSRQTKEETTVPDPIVNKLEAAFPDPPSSLLAEEQIQKALQQLPPPPKSTLKDYQYGLPTPTPVVEVCAGCKSQNAPAPADPEEAKPQSVILLCDGPDCNNEYHLECCIPPIAEVPSGSYFCFDCDPTGSAKVLTKYLDRHEERRHKEITAANNHPFGFLWQLWREDLEENQDNWTDEKEEGAAAAAASTTATKTYQRVPQSELSRLLEVQFHLNGSEPGKPCTLDELGSLFVGKPIRLYCPSDDNYHSGRIIDYRPLPPNLHQTRRGSMSASAKSTAHYKTCYPNDDFFVNRIEFLCRFVPGSDEYRKVLVTRWIRLEEHSLAVGTHLAWGKFHNATTKKGTVTVHHGSPHGNSNAWTPSLLFLRTSRELMPVLHLLEESQGEITYHPSSLLTKTTKANNKTNTATNNPCTAPITKMDPNKVWALAKRLGASTNADGQPAEAYRLLRVADETRALMSRKPTASHLDQLKHTMAMAELREQENCARWRKLPLKNKFHPKALTARDEFALGPVDFENRDKAPEEKELCPLVRGPGLDRGYLMERLLKRGTIEEATKDMAAGLKCWLVP